MEEGIKLFITWSIIFIPIAIYGFWEIGWESKHKWFTLRWILGVSWLMGGFGYILYRIWS